MAAQVHYAWWAMWQNLLSRRRGDFGMLEKIMALFIMALGVSVLMATPAVMRRLNRIKK
jgi:ABC-type lipoprotein release transport system permease subunit